MKKANHLKRFPLAVGECIYEPAMTVRGSQHRKADVANFVKAKEPEVELRIVPDGREYAGAIEVIGVWKGWWLTHRKLIGYVPKEVVAALDGANAKRIVRARLVRTFVDDEGFVDVTIQVVGPKSDFKRYQRQRRNDEGDVLFEAPDSH